MEHNEAVIAQQRLATINVLLQYPDLCPLRKNDLMFEADHLESYLELLEEVAMTSLRLPDAVPNR